MVAYEKIYFEAEEKSQYIWHKNNTEYLYLIFERVKLHWKISSWIRHVPDIHRFPTVQYDETHFLLENLWISESSLGIPTLLLGSP